MTDYEQGFLTKCVELGVPSGLAIDMLKMAGAFPTGPNDGFQAPDENGNITLDGATGTVMRKGDTVSHILQRMKIPQKYLWSVLKDNGLTDATARKLRPGHIIYTRDPAYYSGR